MPLPSPQFVLKGLRLLSGRSLAPAVIALCLASPTVLEAKEKAPRSAPAKDWDLIAFTVQTWGRPVSAWRIGPLGASWDETVQTPGPQGPATQTVIHSIEVGEEGYRKVRDILARMPLPAPDPYVCGQFMSDMAYGTIRFTRGPTTTEIAWNSGCMDESYQAFMGPMKEADELMKSWGKASTNVRTQ